MLDLRRLLDEPRHQEFNLVRASLQIPSCGIDLANCLFTEARQLRLGELPLLMEGLIWSAASRLHLPRSRDGCHAAPACLRATRRHAGSRPGRPVASAPDGMKAVSRLDGVARPTNARPPCSTPSRCEERQWNGGSGRNRNARSILIKGDSLRIAAHHHLRMTASFAKDRCCRCRRNSHDFRMQNIMSARIAVNITACAITLCVPPRRAKGMGSIGSTSTLD